MAFTPVQKLSITSGMALVLLGVAGVLAYLSTSELTKAQAAAAVTNANVARLDRVLARSADAERATHEYVETMNAGALAVLDSAQSDVEYALDSIRIASEDHPVQRRYLDSLGPIVGARFRDLRQAAAGRRLATHDSAVRLLTAIRTVPGPTRLVADMRAEEVRVLGERARLMAASVRRTQLLIVGGSVLAFVLALVALQPLRVSVERRITESISRASITGEDGR